MNDELGSHEESYAIVGELVMLCNFLDTKLNLVAIEVLGLGQAILLPSVIATLDPARKIEMLKARARHMPKNDWKANVDQFLNHIENAFKHRNIACHTPPILREGKWFFQPLAANKLFKGINLKSKTVAEIPLDFLREGIKSAEQAYQLGDKLTSNFRRANEEMAKRKLSDKD